MTDRDDMGAGVATVWLFGRPDYAAAFARAAPFDICFFAALLSVTATICWPTKKP
jgi:hypothetical protein